MTRGAPQLRFDMHRAIISIGLAGAVALAGCTATSPSPQPSESAEPTASPVPFGCEPVRSAAADVFTNIIDVQVTTHDGYDRIVFEFSDGVPQFTIEPAAPPFVHDGSGLPLTVNGNAFWHIWMSGATKLSPTGSITYTGPTEFFVSSQLVHLVEAGDFEAVSNWVAGTDATACIRVQTLSAPDRLVIEIEQ